MTKLYKISIDYNYSVADVTKNLSTSGILDLTSESVGIFDKFEYGWLTDESSIIPDITIIVSQLLCCNETACRQLDVILGKFDKHLCIIGGLKYFILSDIPVLPDVLDLRASSVKYFGTGDIMAITKPTFKAGDYPLLFKTADTDGIYFCTEDFKESVEKCRLSGLVFTECKIKSKSWFKR